jgi:siroheme synthase
MRRLELKRIMRRLIPSKASQYTKVAIVCRKAALLCRAWRTEHKTRKQENTND